MERDRLWLDCVWISICLCAGHADCGPRHRPYRHASGIHDCCCGVEPGIGQPCTCFRFLVVQCCAFRTGCGRSCEFPNSHSNCSRLVSAEGTILRDGNIQQRFQRGCDRCRDIRSISDPSLWLARSVSGDWRSWHALGHTMAALVSEARGTSVGFKVRTDAHPVRWTTGGHDKGSGRRDPRNTARPGLSLSGSS